MLKYGVTLMGSLNRWTGPSDLQALAQGLLAGFFKQSRQIAAAIEFFGVAQGAQFEAFAGAPTHRHRLAGKAFSQVIGQNQRGSIKVAGRQQAADCLEHLGQPCRVALALPRLPVPFEQAWQPGQC